MDEVNANWEKTKKKEKKKERKKFYSTKIKVKKERTFIT